MQESIEYVRSLEDGTDLFRVMIEHPVTRQVTKAIVGLLNGEFVTFENERPTVKIPTVQLN